MNANNESPSQAYLVLSGLVLIYATTNGVLTYTLPMLHPALMENFGWDESQVTQPAAWYLIVTAITSPFAGYILDRFSPKRVIGIGLLGIGLALVLYARVSNLEQLIAVYVVLGTSLSLCGLVSNMLVLTQWFHKNRGFATGVLLTASSLGGFLYPLLMGWGLTNLGWRSSLGWLGLFFVVITLLPLLLLVRDRSPTSPPKPDGPTTSVTGPSLTSALQERRFYLVAIATASVWFGLFAMLNHQPIFIARSLELGEHLAKTLAVFALSSVAGKLAFGYLSDQLDKHITMMLAVATFAAALLFLQNGVTDANSLLVYAVLAGIGFSGTFTMSQVLIAKLYAGPSYGKILGTFIMLDTIAGGIGTIAAGKLRQYAGSYNPVFDMLIIGCTISIVCLAILKVRERSL